MLSAEEKETVGQIIALKLENIVKLVKDRKWEVVSVHQPLKRFEVVFTGGLNMRRTILDVMFTFLVQQLGRRRLSLKRSSVSCASIGIF